MEMKISVKEAASSLKILVPMRIGVGTMHRMWNWQKESQKANSIQMFLM